MESQICSVLYRPYNQLFPGSFHCISLAFFSTILNIWCFFVWLLHCKSIMETPRQIIFPFLCFCEWVNFLSSISWYLFARRVQKGMGPLQQLLQELPRGYWGRRTMPGLPLQGATNKPLKFYRQEPREKTRHLRQLQLGQSVSVVLSSNHLPEKLHPQIQFANICE